MDDQFLKQYRQAPRPEFARQLRNKMEEGTMNAAKPKTWRQNAIRWSPALIAAAVVLAIALVITLPPTRALAQDFLNLFRVKKFAVVTIDPNQIKQFDNLNIDMEQLFAENVQVVKEPGKPAPVGSVAEASERVGYPVAVPSVLPNKAKLEVTVQGEASAILTADVAKAQEILDLLGINDITIPPQLDGAKITINKPASVSLHYTFKNGNVTLMQSPSPEIQLPPGVEMKQFGEIGLRVLGLSPDQARDFAAQVDWNSTFLIPIPANAAQVRQVTVNGSDGLLLTSNGTNRSPMASGDSVLLWANNGMVYGMQGRGSAVDLLEIANSVQ